jgi:hypothetical protein
MQLIVKLYILACLAKVIYKTLYAKYHGQLSHRVQVSQSLQAYKESANSLSYYAKLFFLLPSPIILPVKKNI